ncbi:MAG: ribonuclease H-like domain-containing protein [Ignavibacteriales bacterium]|nr:ribonuclease H-like domain-containing protein [Ignavibacteriales bacterium]
MARVVLDIETLGYPFESFDEVRQEYLLKFAETEAQRTEAIQKLSLYPATAQIIAIGMLNPDTNRGKVIFQSDHAGDSVSEDGQIQFVSCPETEILGHFWNDITKYEQFITFNGRGFDCPFLMLRSAILQVQPSRNLMPYRYDSNVHCDLLDQLTFYGATRKFSLDFYCKSFGIESPKSHGVTGLDLGRLFGQKRFQDIANYCLGDVKATAELFARWEQHLKF